jgi:hypothetical protein
LIACEKLSMLALQNTKLTKAGIERLRAARPKLVLQGQIPQ